VGALEATFVAARAAATTTLLFLAKLVFTLALVLDTCVPKSSRSTSY
jgi:hypothetical protein